MPCGNPRQIPLWLTRRLSAAQSRCTNPNDPAYKNYGARGITFDFKSVLEAGLWVQEHLGLQRNLEIDRINNNSGYAPGNLRWATRSQNAGNRQATKLSEAQHKWAQTQSPYSLSATRKMLYLRMTEEQIINRAKQAVLEKRKNWGGIAKRLVMLGYTTS